MQSLKDLRFVKVGEDIYVVKHLHMKDDGECDTEAKTITLKKKIFESGITNQIVVILHEKWHGVADHFRFTGLVRNKKDEEFLDHIVECIARGQLMTMLDNLELFEWIIRELRKLKRRKAWQKEKRRRKRKR